MDEPSYRWIFELAENKDISFPLLESVHLHETFRERYTMFSLEEWDPPLIIDFAFEEANIELAVYVRVPKRWGVVAPVW